MSTLGEIDVEVYSEPVAHIDFDLNATGRVLAGFGGALCGYALRNMSASVVAEIDLYDGADTSGVPAIPVTLGANESVRDWFGPGGVVWRNALYANVTAGEVKGSVFYRHHRR